jgi:hypothetical protein
MIVDGTVLAPLHTGLLNRRLMKLVSNVHSFNQAWRVRSSDPKGASDVVWFVELVPAGGRGRRSRLCHPSDDDEKNGHEDTTILQVKRHNGWSKDIHDISYLGERWTI